MANIKDLIEAVKSCDSWDEFKTKVRELEPDREPETPGFIKEDVKELKLTDFDEKLKKSLNWNPKDHK